MKNPLRRPTNPHKIINTDLRMTSRGIGATRADLQLAFDVPTHERIWNPYIGLQIGHVIAECLDNRTKSRARRIWEALR